MTLRSSLLSLALLAAIAGCSKPAEPAAEAPAPAAEAAAPAAAEPAPAPAAAPAAPAADATAAAPAAAGCSADIEGNDQMQYNVKNIDVPKTCTDFTINLKHVGKMPVAAMGHNVVIAKTTDIMPVATDGAAVMPDHVKAGDTRVVAHSSMVGGGQSTSVTFPVAKVADGGFSFFCTFPGHAAMMQGTLTIK